MTVCCNPAQAKERSWIARVFRPSAQVIEEPKRVENVCGVVFDGKTGRHIAKDPRHNKVVDLYDRWRALSEGTYTHEREMALFALYGIENVVDLINEHRLNVCPNYGRAVHREMHSGRIREIVDHTLTFHLDRTGADHFGIPVFDFSLLASINASDALKDIQGSIMQSLEGRIGKADTVKSAFYIFHGLRMVRFLETLIEPSEDWARISALFPTVPIPGRQLPENDFGEIEKLEARAFRLHQNRTMD